MKWVLIAILVAFFVTIPNESRVPVVAASVAALQPQQQQQQLLQQHQQRGQHGIVHNSEPEERIEPVMLTIGLVSASLHGARLAKSYHDDRSHPKDNSVHDDPDGRRNENSRKEHKDGGHRRRRHGRHERDDRRYDQREARRYDQREGRRYDKRFNPAYEEKPQRRESHGRKNSGGGRRSRFHRKSKQSPDDYNQASYYGPSNGRQNHRGSGGRQQWSDRGSRSRNRWNGNDAYGLQRRNDDWNYPYPPPRSGSNDRGRGRGFDSESKRKAHFGHNLLGRHKDEYERDNY